MGTAGPYWVTAHPVSWLPYELPAGDDRQVSSQDRRSVKLRVRPPPAGTHQCHRATSAGSGMMLTINTDDHRPRFRRRSYAVGHGLASSDCGPELVRVGGQDCDGPWVQQAPIGSRPIRSAGCRTSCQRAMTDRSVARTVGQSSCGSGHHPPAPTSVTERPRQAAE